MFHYKGDIAFQRCRELWLGRKKISIRRFISEALYCDGKATPCGGICEGHKEGF